MAVGDLVLFNDVFASEKDSIKERRRKNRRPDIELEPEASAGTPLTMSDGTTPLRPADESNVVGLSLSDGGIRSAAFCIGALQALDKAEILPQVDYLSTVSGGGHIRCSLSAGAALTIAATPVVGGRHKANFDGIEIYSFDHFVVTVYLALLLLSVVIV